MCNTFVQSKVCVNLVCDLEIGTQFLDSENAQCNLEIMQIPRLHGTCLFRVVCTHTQAEWERCRTDSDYRNLIIGKFRVYLSVQN